MMAGKRYLLLYVSFLLFSILSIAPQVIGATAPANHSAIIDTTPTFTWTWTDNATTNYTLVIDDSSNMATPIITHTGITDALYTLNATEELLGDDRYYWHVLVYDSGAYLRTISYSYFDLDTTPPVILLVSPENMSWVNKTSVSASIITNEDSTCRYSIVKNVPWGAKTAMSGTGVLTHAATFSLTAQSVNDFFIQCQDNLSNQVALADEVNYTIMLDSAGPAPGTVSIDSGEGYTNSSTVTLSWSGFNDSYHGIKYYYYSTSNSPGTRSGIQVDNLTTSVSYVGLTAGTRTLYVWAEDNLNNVASASASDSIVIDFTNPTLSTWTESPSNLRYNWDNIFNISVAVVDTNFLPGNPPECRYRFKYGSTFNTSYTDWEDMTLSSGTTYWYSIDENWSNWGGHYIYYECRAFDAVYHMVNGTQNEYIDLSENPPSFVSLGDISGTERHNMSFAIMGTDVDEDSLTFGSNYNFSFKTLTSTSATAWIVPSNSIVGPNTVTFYVTDGIYNVSSSVAFTVSPANDPPVLDPVGNLETYLHEPFTHVITASDLDNQNSYIFDDDLLTFGTVENISWFRISSRYNISSGESYGLINFTPLLSHKGSMNLTISVTDGTATDSEEIIFTVGYCGDLDTAGEPKCDSEYESCGSCPEDCGVCDVNSNQYMAIVVPEKNCVNQKFTLETFTLVDRGECEVEGGIVNGREICGNLTDVTITVYDLENKEWVELGQYTSDENGMVSFIPTISGSYKLVGTRRSYVNAIKYLDFAECTKLSQTIKNTTGTSSSKSSSTNNSNNKNSTSGGNDKKSQTETPGAIDTENTVVVKDATLFQTILWYIIIPVLLMGLVASSYLYYQSNKDDVAWILRARIFAYTQKKVILEKVSGWFGRKGEE
jgi:hypothetical protein